MFWGVILYFLKYYEHHRPHNRQHDEEIRSQRCSVTSPDLLWTCMSPKVIYSLSDSNTWGLENITRYLDGEETGLPSLMQIILKIILDGKQDLPLRQKVPTNDIIVRTFLFNLFSVSHSDESSTRLWTPLGRGLSESSGKIRYRLEGLRGERTKRGTINKQLLWPGKRDTIQGVKP